MQEHSGRSTKVALGVALAAALALAACGGGASPAAGTTTAPTTAATTAAPTAAATTAAAAANATVKGSITKLAEDGKFVTVKTTDGKELVFEVSSSRTALTDTRPGGGVKSRGDLKVGMQVTVEGPAAGGEAKTFAVTG